MADRITITLERDTPKKNSVVYRGESDSGFRYSLYVGNDDVAKLRDPSKLTVTLEDAS